MNAFAKTAAVALLALAGAASVTSAEAGPVYVDVRVAPPAPRYEVAPAYRSGYVWSPGYWDWRYNRYAWVPGSYLAHRPGYVYTAPVWVNNGPGWHLYRGAWARGDRDHDGIPNRYDRNDNRGYHGNGNAYGRRDRDRDGVPNRYDRDRDGDGRRNRNDRRPDNPNRR